MDRRNFFISTAAAAAASTTVFGSPSDTLRVATIGLRGRGKDHIKEITGQPNVELVALCDIDQKVLDAARLQGRVRLLADGTGHLAFGKKHCDRCLVQRHETHTVYLHKVLEVKVLGPAGLVLSIGSAFIENSDDPGTGSAQQRKQDCELKALDRAAGQIKRDFPQTRFCLSVNEH